MERVSGLGDLKSPSLRKSPSSSAPKGRKLSKGDNFVSGIPTLSPIGFGKNTGINQAGQPSKLADRRPRSGRSKSPNANRPLSAQK